MRYGVLLSVVLVCMLVRTASAQDLMFSFALPYQGTPQQALYRSERIMQAMGGKLASQEDRAPLFNRSFDFRDLWGNQSILLVIRTADPGDAQMSVSCTSRGGRGAKELCQEFQRRFQGDQ